MCYCLHNNLFYYHQQWIGFLINSRRQSWNRGGGSVLCWIYMLVVLSFLSSKLSFQRSINLLKAQDYVHSKRFMSEPFKSQTFKIEAVLAESYQEAGGSFKSQTFHIGRTNHKTTFCFLNRLWLNRTGRYIIIQIHISLKFCNLEKLFYLIWTFT